MDVKVKKYKLKYGGEYYGPGDVVALPDKEAKELCKRDPEAFEIVKTSKAATKQKSTEKLDQIADTDDIDSLDDFDPAKTVAK